jgi:hypothetical protein
MSFDVVFVRTAVEAILIDYALTVGDRMPHERKIILSECSIKELTASINHSYGQNFSESTVGRVVRGLKEIAVKQASEFGKCSYCLSHYKTIHSKDASITLEQRTAASEELLQHRVQMYVERNKMMKQILTSRKAPELQGGVVKKWVLKIDAMDGNKTELPILSQHAKDDKLVNVPFHVGKN